MGSDNHKRWFHVLRDRILGTGELSEGEDGDDIGVGEEIRRQADSGCDGMQDAPPAQHDELTVETEKLPPDVSDSEYRPPKSPEDVPPQVLGAVSDGTSMMYVQTCFWVAAYVQQRALVGDFTHDQLIEQFGVNVRRCIDPSWKAEG